jgi:hypothetical protein
MKKLFVVILSMFSLYSCKKEIVTDDLNNKPSIHTEVNKAIPVEGLVVISTPYTMSQLTDDNDPVLKHNNEHLAILAQAFQHIACDSNFSTAIGQAIDAELECSVEHFLENNQNYKAAVNAWLTNNGHNTYNSLLTGNEDKAWIYAANYGVHTTATPVLAIAIELDSVILGENDDFIPCFYSESDCNNYETGMVGLEGDLDPEEPSLPNRALTIVFSDEAEESYNKKERKNIGDVSSYTGAVIDPGIPGCGEQGDSYEITTVFVKQKFNRSKKVKVATRFVAHDNCNGWDNSDHKFGKDKIIQGKNILNQVHSTNYDLLTCPYATFTCHVAYKDVVGIVFEKDWYSSKWISGNFGSANCPIRYWERKIKSKNDDEIYAYFSFYADWCLNEVREFNVPLSEEGDHQAYIRIKSTTM